MRVGDVGVGGLAEYHVYRNLYGYFFLAVDLTPCLVTGRSYNCMV